MTGTSRLAPMLAALLGPLLVLAPPLLWWARPAEPTPPDATALRIEKAMASDPDVVVLGASKAWTDLDPESLARELGLPPGSVGRANISGSRSAVWYAILKNRVFGSGATPKVVIIYGGFDSLVQAVPASDGERAVLLAQMGPDEPVLKRKSLGDDSGTSEVVERVRQRRTDFHRDAMARLRDGAVGLILGGDAAAGSAIAGPALERLFGLDAAVDVSAARRAIPVVEAERTNTSSTSVTLESTLIPDLVELAKSNGARLVVGIAPNRSGVDKAGAGPAELLSQAVALFNAEGVGFTDLRELGLPDSAFGDAVHLNQVGKKQMTHALAQRLLEMDALAEGPIATAKVPVVRARPQVRRTGSPPTLPAVAPTRGPGVCGWVTKTDGLSELSDTALGRAGLGAISPLVLLEDGKPLVAHANKERFDNTCGGAFSHQDRVVKFAPTEAPPESAAGHTYTFALDDSVPMLAGGQEVWWVYPGTSIELSFAEAWGAGEFAVMVHATAAVPGAGAQIELDGTPPVPLESNGIALTAQARAPAPTGPWKLRVSSPADGPWLLLRAITAGDPADPTTLLGTSGRSAAPLKSPTATWAAPPRTLPQVPSTATKDGLLEFKFDAGVVPDVGYLARTGGVNNCSPLLVRAADGTVLTRFGRRPDILTPPDSFTQVGLSLLVHSTRTPLLPELDPKRDCHGLRWLYPGDDVSIEVPKTRLAALLAPGQKLELAGAVGAEAPTTAKLHVRLRSGEEVLVDAEVPIEDLRAGAASLPLAREALVEALTLQLSTSPDAPFFLVNHLAVVE